MGTAFWIKRFFTVLIIAFAVICAAQLLKGRDLADAVTQAVIWSVFSAAVFTAARIVQSRRGQHCAVCKDTPEMQQGDEKTGN
ncbi:MAG TPA: hypothetical protein VIT67_13590 [Povalibacter sp.]